MFSLGFSLPSRWLSLVMAIDYSNPWLFTAGWLFWRIWTMRGFFVGMAVLRSGNLVGDPHAVDMHIADEHVHVFVPLRWCRARLWPGASSHCAWVSGSAQDHSMKESSQVSSAAQDRFALGARTFRRRGTCAPASLPPQPSPDEAATAVVDRCFHSREETQGRRLGSRHRAPPRCGPRRPRRQAREAAPSGSGGLRQLGGPRVRDLPPGIRNGAGSGRAAGCPHLCRASARGVRTVNLKRSSSPTDLPTTRFLFMPLLGTFRAGAGTPDSSPGICAGARTEGPERSRLLSRERPWGGPQQLYGTVMRRVANTVRAI